MKAVLLTLISLLFSLLLSAQCIPQSAPYQQNFDYLNSFPPCTFINSVTIEPGGRTGNCLSLVSTASVNAYLILPELQIPSDSIEVTFWLKTNIYISKPFAFALALVSDTADIEGTMTVIHYDLCPSNQWTEFRFHTAGLPVPVTATSRLAILLPNAGNHTLLIDDIDIHHTPTCFRPEDISVNNITSSTCDVSWRGNTNARIDVSDFATTTSHTVSSSPATISNLSPYTHYSVTVTSICSPGDTSETSISHSFYTKAYCAYPNNVGISDVHANDFRLSWTTKNFGTEVQGFYCLYQDSTLIECDTFRTYNKYQLFSNLSPVTQYTLIGWVRTDCYGGNYSDSVPFEFHFSTLCNDIANVYLTNITDSTVLVNINDPSVTNWVCTCCRVGEDPDTTPSLIANTTNVAFTNLLPGTGYLIYTRRFCGQRLSPWSNSYSFTTTGTPIHEHCPQPYNGSVRSLNSTVAVVDWVDSTAVSSWLVEAIPSSGQAIIQHSSYHPIYLLGLDSTVSYNVYVSALCSSIDTSAPMLCGTISAYPLICYPLSYEPSIVSISDSSLTLSSRNPDTYEFQYAIAPYPSYTVRDTFASVAGQDTVTFNNLTPGTTYTIYLRGFCIHPQTQQRDTTDWLSDFFTTSEPLGSLPFVCDFEDTAQNALWQYLQTQTNQFIISSAVSNGGSRSLHVSYDGSSYAYNPSKTSYASAYFPLTVPAGDYDYSFDWRCYGYTDYSCGRFLLLPASVALDYTLWISYLNNGNLPPDAIALDNNANLQNQNSFSTISGSFHISTPGTYNLVATWKNVLSGGSNPPLSIDNISIVPKPCASPSASLVYTQGATADILVSSAIPGSDLLYGLSVDGSTPQNYRTIPVTSSSFTLHLDSLSASTSYTLYLRNLCTNGLLTIHTTLVFATGCGTVNAFPYTQSFESIEVDTSSANLLDTICWRVVNYGNVTASSYKYPDFKAVTSQHSHGSKCLELSSYRQEPLFLILPEMSDLSLLQLSFDFRTETSTYSCGIIHAGYLTDATDTSTFVSLIYTPRTTSWATYSTLFLNAPAGARIALRFSDAGMLNFYSYLDNVVVSHLATMPAFNDTICFSDDYNLHGFSIPSTQLPLGDTTVYRVVSSAGASVIYQANIHRIPDSYTVIYDTLPAYQRYTKGLFDIPSPQTYYYYATTPSRYGCDSTVELHLTVTLDSIVDTTICQGGYLILGDIIVTQPGTYTHTSIDPRGYTVTYYLTLSIDTVHPAHAYDVACEGYLYFGNDISALLVKSDTVILVRRKALDMSCDSLTYVHLTLQHTAHIDTTIILVGDSVYYWEGVPYLSPGTYTRTFITDHGCDSVVTLTLTSSPASLQNPSDGITVTLIPNPVMAGNSVDLYLEKPDEIEEICLFNSLGQPIMTLSSSTTLTAPSAPAIYYLRISLRSGKVLTMPLIVK